MVVIVHKNAKESFERFLSRFDSKVQRLRIVRLLRERRFRPDKLHKSKRLIRESALKREEYRARRRRLKFY